jgi:hypothetical protein
MNTAPSEVESVEHWLGYLGLIPFVYLTTGLPIPGVFAPIEAFTLYSLVILVFMAGTLWRHGAKTSLFSNVVTLAGFFGFLLLTPVSLLFLLGLLFLALWIWEWQLLRPDYSAAYWRLRCRLTAVVIICHIIWPLRLW